MDPALPSGELVAAGSKSLPAATNFCEDPPDLVAPGEPIPTFRSLGGPPVPDLARLPRDRWREALIPCSPSMREAAVFNYRLGKDGILAAEALLRTLPPPPSEAGRLDVPAVPYEAVPPVRHRSRQLSIRVTADAYRDLELAVRLLGGTPTQVARMLIHAGVRRLLADYDVAMDQRTTRVNRT